MEFPIVQPSKKLFISHQVFNSAHMRIWGLKLLLGGESDTIQSGKGSFLE